MVVTHLLRRSFAEASQKLRKVQKFGFWQALPEPKFLHLAKRHLQGGLQGLQLRDRWMKLYEIVAQTVLCLTSLGSL
jgi:hypothetical protein